MADNKIVLVNQTAIGKELQKMKGQIEAALPRHITPDRMARIALTALRTNPKLTQSTLESFFGSIIMASQLGLEPGVNGQCFLVPYKNSQSGLLICTFIPGWRGYMDLVSRTGRAGAWTGAVFDQDEFDYEYGDKPFIHHKPGKWSGEKSALMFTYGVGRVNKMDWPVIEVWEIDKIWKHRDKNNKCWDKSDHYSFKYPEQYARKIPLLQVIKYLPSSVELSNASTLDIAGTDGKQALTIDMAFKGELGSGESTDKEIEIESLMEKLGWDAAKREATRESYLNRPGGADELLDYVRKQSGPLEVHTNGVKQGTQDTKPETQQQGSQDTGKNPEPAATGGRGGRKKKSDEAPKDQTPEGSKPTDDASAPQPDPQQTTQESKPGPKDLPATGRFAGF